MGEGLVVVTKVFPAQRLQIRERRYDAESKCVIELDRGAISPSKLTRTNILTRPSLADGEALSSSNI
jgi:hypothetical protein